MRTDHPPPTPTDTWLASTAAFMPPLTGPAGTAERLLLLVHYGIDWEGSWVGSRRQTYWEQILPDRVIAATFLQPTLPRWWREVTDELHSSPRNADERRETEALLRVEPLPVLAVLRNEAEPLLLRTRIVTESVRSAKSSRDTGKRDGD